MTSCDQRRRWLPRVLPALLVCTLIHAADGRLQIGDRALAQLERQYGQPARTRIERWRDLLRESTGLAEADQLRRVNDFFNQARFIDDIDHWGKADYWATPLEMLATNGGDCEDFSIAKYVSLRDLGVPDERLRIVYVKALTLNQAHMVLAYFPAPSADPLILDNLDPTIKPASRRPDLQPVYSFNTDGLWLAQGGAGDTKAGGAERLGLWVDVQDRLRRELSP